MPKREISDLATTSKDKRLKYLSDENDDSGSESSDCESYLELPDSLDSFDITDLNEEQGTDTLAFASSPSPTTKLFHSLIHNKDYLKKISEAMRSANHQPITAYEKSVVKIQCNSKEFSYEYPWQAATQQKCGGSGFVLNYNGHTLIMSNAHVVSDVSHLTVRLADETTWYTANVELVDHDCDLSILSVASAEFMSRAIPFVLGELSAMRKSLTVLGFPIGGDELFVADGTVSRIEVDSYCWSGLDLLQIQVTAAINSGNSGGPVLNTAGEVIGVAFQGMRGYEGLGYIIPSPIIKHFLDDYLLSLNTGQPYQGFPNLNFTYQRLQSPEYRVALKLDTNDVGIRIKKIAPLCSSFNIMQPEDILIELDDKIVHNDGTVQTEFSKRVMLDYLLSNKHINESITAKVIRNGATIDLSIPLRFRAETTSIIGSTERDKPPTYYIFCATVFVPITENIADDLDLSADQQQQFKKFPGHELVTIREVFSCTYTTRQTICKDHIVKKVNGEQVKNLRHLIHLIENSNEEYIIIRTNDDLECSLKRISKNEHMNILSKFVIHSDRSQDLLNPPIFRPGCPEYKQQLTEPSRMNTPVPFF